MSFMTYRSVEHIYRYFTRVREPEVASGIPTKSYSFNLIDKLLIHRPIIVGHDNKNIPKSKGVVLTIVCFLGDDKLTRIVNVNQTDSILLGENSFIPGKGERPTKPEGQVFTLIQRGIHDNSF